MSDNDNDGHEPIEISPHDFAANSDLGRRMKVILPMLQEFLQKLDTATQQDSLDHEKLAVEYRIWRDAAVAAIAVHWNQFEQGLTPAQRAEQLPHAAEDFAEEILRPSEFEAIKEHLAARDPQKSVREGEQFYTDFEKVRLAAPAIDMKNVTSFAQRSIKNAGKPGLPDH